MSVRIALVAPCSAESGLASGPDCLVLCCCGLDLDKTEKIVCEELEASTWWRADSARQLAPVACAATMGAGRGRRRRCCMRCLPAAWRCSR